MRVKRDEKSLNKKKAGRKTLLLALVLLLALSPVSWGRVFGGGPGPGMDGAAARGESDAQAALTRESILETAYAADPGGADDDSGGGAGDITREPTVKVVGVNVKNTDTLEVGIQVGGLDQPLFQSVGLVLEYDKSKLTPIDWDEGWKDSQTAPSARNSGAEGETESPGGPAVTTSPSSVQIAGEEDWKSRVVYTPTWINSGTAQIYEPSAGSGGTGSGDGTGSIGAAGKGYLLLQASTEYPYSLPTARQIVTVKFQYLEQTTPSGGAIGKADSFADAGLALAGSGSGASAADQQAGKQVSFTSRIGHVGLYSASNATSMQQFYHTPLKDGGGGTAADDSSLNGQKLNVNFGTAIEEGETQQAAGGGTGGVPIIFYDWDGTTLLGSVVINPSDTEDTILAAMDGFTELMKASEEERRELAAQNPDNVTEFWTNLPEKPLTYKKGYTFGLWISLGSDAITSYGSAPEPGDNTSMVEIPAPVPADLQNIPSTGLSVKAAYVANGDMSALTSAPDRLYTVTPVDFNRFGLSENFAVDLKVVRNNGTSGVHRCREPYLRVQMNMKDGSKLYQLVAIDNVDEATAQVVPTGAVTSVNCTVVDAYEVTDWVNGAAARSLETFIVPAVSVGETKGFLRYGTLAMMNDQLSLTTFTSMEIWSITDIILFDQLQLADSSGYRDAYTASINLKAAWDAKNPGYVSGNPYEALTFEEMQYAVDHNGELKP